MLGVLNTDRKKAKKEEIVATHRIVWDEFCVTVDCGADKNVYKYGARPWSS